jgi:peroxiredoxin
MVKFEQFLINLLFLAISIFTAIIFYGYSGAGNSPTKEEIEMNRLKLDFPDAPRISQKLGDFFLKNEMGELAFFYEIKGESPALIYFFSGGCNHCSQMLSQMQQNEILYKAKTLGYKVLGVQYHATPKQCKEMIDTYKFPSPILADQDARLSTKFRIEDFAIFLVGKDKTLYFRDGIDGNNWPSDEKLKDIAERNASY